MEEVKNRYIRLLIVLIIIFVVMTIAMKNQSQSINSNEEITNKTEQKIENTAATDENNKNQLLEQNNQEITNNLQSTENNIVQNNETNPNQNIQENYQPSTENTNISNGTMIESQNVPQLSHQKELEAFQAGINAQNAMNLNLAIEHYKKLENSNNQTLKIESLKKIIECYLQMKNLSTAEETYEKLSPYLNESEKTDILNSIAKEYENTYKYEQAYELYYKNTQITRSIDDMLNVCRILKLMNNKSLLRQKIDEFSVERPEYAQEFSPFMDFVMGVNSQ